MPSKNNLGALKGGASVSPILPDPDRPPPPQQTAPRKVARVTVKRVNKGFQVEEGRARKWDLLVARMKADGKNGPQLIDEALDYLFDKYGA